MIKSPVFTLNDQLYLCFTIYYFTMLTYVACGASESLIAVTNKLVDTIGASPTITGIISAFINVYVNRKQIHQYL